jgi:N-carbamoyl-L-amino-acid hydrolase
MGSHLDSVPHGGNFDGAAGVIAGLVVIEALRSLGVHPRRDVTVMGVRAEESIWFQVSYVGSRSALGRLPDGALEAKRIDNGKSLAAHIAECGGDPEAIRRRERHLDPATIRAFLEVHIEQAPSLVESRLPLAICSGVPGNFRYPNARIVGRHDHVGTPRRFRHDAAMAGAELAMKLDRIWEEEEKAGVPLAVTFGRFHTDAAAHGMTIVPGAFAFSLDVRAYDAAVLERVEKQMLAAIADIEARRRVTFELGARASAAVGKVDPEIVAALEAGAARHDIATMRLGSPASHDSAAFAEVGIPMAMLFVRNEHGSHNPMEAMEIDDFLAACTVLADWVAAEVT